jgi:hypothetical protein
MRRLFLLSVSITLLLGALPAAGSPAYGVLTGTVLNARNRPVAAARVFLQSADGTAPRVLRTDGHGVFHTPPLQTGLYDVRAEAAGNWSPWAHNVVLKSGKENEIKLRLLLQAPPKIPK